MSQNLAALLNLALDALFTNGLWPAKAPDNQVAPFGVLTHFGATNQFLVGRGTDQNQRVQIDVYAETNDAAAALADQVEAAMDSHSLNSSPSMFTATQLTRAAVAFDAATKYQRIILEFSVWYRP